MNTPSPTTEQILKLPKWAQAHLAENDKQLLLARAFCWPTQPEPKPISHEEIEANSSYDKPMPGWFSHTNAERFAATLGCSTTISHNREGKFTTSQNMGVMYHTKAEALLVCRWQMCRSFAAALARLDIGGDGSQSINPMQTSPLLRRCVTSDEAVRTQRQHRKPCADCPFAKTALNGWLGGETIEDWLQCIHTDTIINCHCTTNQQCAGAAIYRANVFKRVRSAEALALPPDDGKLVFSDDNAFRKHHSQRPQIKRLAN